MDDEAVIERLTQVRGIGRWSAEMFLMFQLRRADGTSEPLPLTGPWQGSPGEGVYWEHATDTAKVRIIDGCALGGAYWMLAAAVTDEPLELVVTDPRTGNALEQVLWTDREDVSRLADTSGLACLGV